MKNTLFTRTFIILFSIACSSCNAQVKTNDPQSTDIKPKLIKNHFIPDLAEEFMFVQSGLQDRLGNMWFVQQATEFMFMMALPEAKDFNLYLIPQNTINSSTGKRSPYVFQTGDNFVWSIMQDKSGKIWFGTSKGIYIHDPTKDYDKDEPLFRYFLDNDSLINNNNLKLMDISAMLQDRYGNIWLSSAWSKGEGIVVFDGKSLNNFTPDSINSFRSIIEKTMEICYF
ncbi:MAG: hypothetical protein IPH42_01970 [Bacteroidetes bacterium]|nr:hypothetical protein [Bacteroidota bacterium]